MSTTGDNARDPEVAAATDTPRPFAGRISDAEHDALRARRARNGDSADDGTPLIGLALSGGGIRSATFCLGLLRGLAQRGLLKRFDYLSTVSGGGYIGAMFARLVSVLGIDRAQALLARSDSIPLSWLRRYGRYLAPMGARDFGIGIATYLRAIIAVHMEFAMMAMVVGLLATSAYTLDAQVGALDAGAWSGWGSIWWPLAVASWLAVAPGLLVLYWMVRVDARTPRSPVRSTESRIDQPARIGAVDALLILGSGALGISLVAGWGEDWTDAVGAWFSGGAGGRWPALPGPTWSLGIGIGLVGIGAAGVAAMLRLTRARRAGDPVSLPAARRILTAWLRGINLMAVVLAALGLLDWLSWELHKILSASYAGLFGGLGLGGAFLLAIRSLSEPLQRTIQSSRSASADLLPRLVNIAGYTLAFGLVLLWTTLVQHLIYGGFSLGDCQPSLPVAACDALVSSAGWRWLFVALLPLAWFFATGWNADNANASSLHNMYAARLARAYLGAANVERFGGEDALQASAADTSPEALSDVTAVDESDDVPLRAHRPTEQGGPIHLINVCLNQTRGHQTRLYNADRKGVPMVLSGYGIDVGHKPLPDATLDGIGGLARWVGISGAAASPGAGVNTTPGWAALLFLAGARLGYWLNLGDAWAALERGMVARAPRWWELRFAKMLRLYAEFRAAYAGPLAPDWYLSDGGHFDNTGVHPLLQRQLDLIVLADCGADPKFEYADLENLVRKARIDYGAEIEFYRAEEANRRFGPPAGEGAAARLVYLSPQELVDNHTARGVLLARILYRADAQGRRREGTLLVFKPNLHALLDVDILAYARRRRDFPQQGTGDQFFDEAQWESYHRLGEDFGTELGAAMLARLPGWSQSVLLPPDRQLRIATSSLSKPHDESRPFWKLQTQQAAVGALSLGALVAVLMPVWQAFDEWRSEQARNRETLATLLDKAEGIFRVASQRTLEQRAYEAMIDALSPSGTDMGAGTDDAATAPARFRAFDAYAGSDPVAGRLLKDLAATLEPMRATLQSGTVDAAAFAQRVDALASVLRQRRHAMPDPASYSDRMAIARFRQLSDTVRGDDSDVRIAKAFLVMAAKTCGNPTDTHVRPEVLCGELRGNDTRDLDPSAYWVRLREDEHLDAGPTLRYAVAEPVVAPVAARLPVVAAQDKGTTTDAVASQVVTPPMPTAVVKTDPSTSTDIADAATVATVTTPDRDVAMTETRRLDPRRLKILRSVPASVATTPAATMPAAALSVALPADAWPARLARSCPGSRKQLFVHIHEESARAPLAGLAWDSIAATFRMQGIENVSITSAAQGREAPRPHPVPTLLVHDLRRNGDCAAALTEWIATQWPQRDASLEFRIRGLPRGYTGRPGVIELWWPPQDAQAGIGAKGGP
ncbi:patatin-like phospholipase family protein [Lysobacter brunescens]|uniref:Patatin-like phospholipase family protein n=1 Tax=Lysobacter brunescens TaxID=262323 RepID=A0ABW2Y7B7_9GAMM